MKNTLNQPFALTYLFSSNDGSTSIRPKRVSHRTGIHLTNTIKKGRLILVTAFVSLFLFSCHEDDAAETPASIAPFSIENDTTLSLNGVIGSTTLVALNEAIRRNPDSRLLIFKEAPGSEDDETNVQVGRKLRQLGLNTHVAANGFIASGAVDLFLAGTLRSLGNNARVGVHSWSAGQKQATDFPRDSEEHQLFIRYYVDIGLSQQLAEDFYFFTIEAASAEDIHWMTAAEIERYSITNP